LQASPAQDFLKGAVVNNNNYIKKNLYINYDYQNDGDDDLEGSVTKPTRLNEIKNSIIEYNISNPESGFQFHFPGNNYTGPGTHIVSNILNNVPPVNKTDYNTMIHDIDYMLAQTKMDALVADAVAIKNTDFDLSGITTKLGLTARSLLLPGSFYGGDYNTGKLLKEYIQLDPFWILQRQKYT